ncbi:MAG: hypothetical protein WC683_04695 [bacterium]
MTNQATYDQEPQAPKTTDAEPARGFPWCLIGKTVRVYYFTPDKKLTLASGRAQAVSEGWVLIGKSWIRLDCPGVGEIALEAEDDAKE